MDPPLTRLIYCLVVACIGLQLVEGVLNDTCDSPQYLDFGQTGTVHCIFQDNLLGVLWYNSLETSRDSLIIKFWDSTRTGRGYDSGEYDVFANGSLKINNVSFVHDGNFTVVKFKSLEFEPQEIVIRLIITVKPSTSHPLIQGCANISKTCFSQYKAESQAICTARNVRPAIRLEWMLRTPFGDRNLSSEVTVEQHETTWTTVAVTREAFSHMSVLSLLICKAYSQPQMFHSDEATIIVEDNNTSFSSLSPVQTFIERYSKLELLCTPSDAYLIVWKKAHEHNNYKLIVYAHFLDKMVSVRQFDGYELNPDGSLMVPSTDVKHEGLYGCSYETISAGDRALFNVTVYVPAYPVVTGCYTYQYCTLEAHEEGNITCSVRGIRPLAHPEVRTVNELHSSTITFNDREVTVNKDGDVYDVRTTFKYRIFQTFRERLTLECIISGTNIESLKSATTFDLILAKEQPTVPPQKIVIYPFLWLILALIPPSLLVIFFVWYVRHKDRQSQKVTKDFQGSQDEENLPMFSALLDGQSVEEKRNLFAKQLGGKYEDLYNAVQPIPYIRDRLFCVDRVFVEGGLECLASSNQVVSDKKWEPLHTYHDILNNPHMRSTRLLIEGEPGYGKSTLTLQFAYDWCNRTSQSALRDVQILILLRLRQLGGVSSIYRAIKQFILPRDSQLTETDIRNIIASTSSIVMILDGYDEYPDQDDVTTDIHNIINRQMFQDLNVVLTTRSSCFPYKYPPQTKRIRLTGFDEAARTKYLKKAVVGYDSMAADQITRRIKENSVLTDICQVPLLFVMYAHMSHESEKKLDFHSVSGFFGYMIACFHSHMFNKMEDENVEKLKLFETEHQQLDEAAFKGLTDKKQKIVWKRDNLRKRIGENLYDQYIRTGILIEEDISDITDVSGFHENVFPYDKTEVRFYHKLFGEWYAAHALTERAKTLSVWRLKRLLRNVDPFDLQYLYRFACGMNEKAAEKIIKHLKETQGGDKFAILCLLEKSGDMGAINDTIRELCTRPVGITEDDTKLLQRSTIQLLEIASKSEISISFVYLSNCFSTVDLSGGNHLQLKSNLSIPVLTTLNELTINTYNEGREITAEEFTGILQYSSKCLALKELWFWFCLLPQYVQAEYVSILRTRNVKVIWVNLRSYKLNLQSCHWEHEDWPGNVIVMTDDDYQAEVEEFRKEQRRLR